MKYEMTMEQRDQVMGMLTEEQRHFLHHELVRGRRTLFAKQLARKKCQFIPEDAQFEDIESFIEEWDYIGFTDSGEVSPHTKCECGRSLRYQHQVLHLPTNTVRYFGIEHLQLHTGIDAKAISDIMKGFDVLDGEMNEMLSKYRDGWQLDQYLFLPLPAELDIPFDIQAHIDAKLPLLDRQLSRIRSRMHELDLASRKKRLATALTYFNEDADLVKSSDVSQDTFNYDNANSGQGVFDFNNHTNGQGAFVFDEIENSQGAFIFDDVDENQGAFAFDEPHTSQDTLSFEEAGKKLGAAYLRESELASSNSKTGSPFYLSASAQHVVDDALKYGRVSALAISNFLIEQKLVQDKRMTTGKPDIYIAVSAYLDKLLATGHCELVIGNSEDRTYSSTKG